MTTPLICTPSSMNTRLNEKAWINQFTCFFNCYAYALNIPRAGFAIPGQLLQEKLNYRHRITTENVVQWLREDGLQDISEDEAMKGEKHVIAVRLSDFDFHFLRRDPNGLWSEKSDERRPYQTDRGDRTITNPRIAPYLSYDRFGGYFAIPDEGIPYLSREDIPSPYLETMTSAYPK